MSLIKLVKVDFKKLYSEAFRLEYEGIINGANCTTEALISRLRM
jgi:hypothetical protein